MCPTSDIDPDSELCSDSDDNLVSSATPSPQPVAKKRSRPASASPGRPVKKSKASATNLNVCLQSDGIPRIPTPPHSDASSSDSACSLPVEEVQVRPSSHEFNLLDLSSGPCGAKTHQVTTAPLFSRSAYEAGTERGISQYGLFGNVIGIHGTGGHETLEDPRLYVNTNAPFSAIVCGVQGSGKSHTVSVLLENLVISPCSLIGSSSKPLAGLVLHFGEAGTSSRPCEAACIGRAVAEDIHPPRIKVYVSPASRKTMARAYSSIDDGIVVASLRFTEAELDAQAFLSMMAVDSSESTPLYMQIVLSILRKLGETFTYSAFKTQLDKQFFNPAQRAGLDQRLKLLESFMSKSAEEKVSRFSAGQLTIVDLTDPFIDPGSACGLFEIITRLFIRAEVGTGKVLVVDEAHKYLSESGSGAGLTKSLISLTRQMRHFGLRVVISTQEPTTVPAVLLDLCGVAVLHRFSSPAWWEHVSKHFSANFNLGSTSALDQIVNLETGEAIVLAPSALVTSNGKRSKQSKGELEYLGRRYMIVKTRIRITKDGGASIMVV